MALQFVFQWVLALFSWIYDKPPIEANKVNVTNIERVGLVKRRASIVVVGKDKEGRIEENMPKSLVVIKYLANEFFYYMCTWVWKEICEKLHNIKLKKEGV